MDRIGWRGERRVSFYSPHPMNPIYPSSKEELLRSFEKQVFAAASVNRPFRQL
jgi:hypothetical protein